METTENNQLIAEFMNVDQVDIDQAYEDYRELRYHTSWDWLMPVVEKIENLGYNTLISDFQTQISFNGVDNIQRNVVNIFSSEESTKLNEVYKAVVEFIKWYNENK